MKIQKKLLLVFLSISLVIICTYTFISVQAYKNGVEKELRERIDRAWAMVAHHFEKYEQRAMSCAYLISYNQELREEFLKNDRLAMLKRLSRINIRTRLDWIELIGMDLTIKASLGNLSSSGEIARGSHIQNALKGYEENKMVRIADQIRLLAVVNIESRGSIGGEKQGILVAGYNIDTHLLDQIKRDTGLDIVIFDHRKSVSSTAFGENYQRSDYQLPQDLFFQLYKNKKGKIIQKLDFFGSKYQTIFACLDPNDRNVNELPITMMVGFPIDYVDKDVKKYLSQEISVAWFILIITSLVTYIVARGISIPIINLSKKMLLVAEKELSLNVNKENITISKIERDNSGFLLNSSGMNESQLLGKCFDCLLDAVRKSNHQLKTYADDLEITVNERTKELRETHQKMIDLAHQEGMAQIARNVIHDVGNVLNSVNASASVLQEQIRCSKISGISRLNSLLKEKDDLDSFFLSEKGKTIPHYISVLDESLTSERKKMAEDIQSLLENIRHIADVINMQHAHTKGSGLVEKVDISDLMEKSLRIHLKPLEEMNVKIKRDYDDLYLVCLEKNKFLQIIINLIGNAKDALQAKKGKDKILVIRVKKEKIDPPKIKIEIEDNGVGIEEKSLSQIFQHGYTTRKNGQGFGLHSSANLAQEMSGTLSAQSKGKDKGAIFTLTLPFKQFTRRDLS